MQMFYEGPSEPLQHSLKDIQIHLTDVLRKWDKLKIPPGASVKDEIAGIRLSATSHKLLQHLCRVLNIVAIPTRDGGVALRLKLSAVARNDS